MYGETLGTQLLTLVESKDYMGGLEMREGEEQSDVTIL